jgi:hypothetical protein
MGMLHEFESTDWDGLRTSLAYAFEGVMIDIPTAATLKAVGVWNAEAGGDMLERRMGVGMAGLTVRRIVEDGLPSFAFGTRRQSTIGTAYNPITT